MKEAEITKRAIEKLQDDGYVVWKPNKVKFMQNDIFGVFDLVAVRKGAAPVFIQLTTYSNASKRCRKIMKFFTDNNVAIMHSYVWAWHVDRFRRYVVLPDAYGEI